MLWTRCLRVTARSSWPSIPNGLAAHPIATSQQAKPTHHTSSSSPNLLLASSSLHVPDTAPSAPNAREAHVPIPTCPRSNFSSSTVPATDNSRARSFSAYVDCALVCHVVSACWGRGRCAFWIPRFAARKARRRDAGAGAGRRRRACRR
jgi:hypothetical protein